MLGAAREPRHETEAQMGNRLLRTVFLTASVLLGGGALGCGPPAAAPVEPTIVVVPPQEGPLSSPAEAGPVPDRHDEPVARERAPAPAGASSPSSPPPVSSAAQGQATPAVLAQARQLFSTGVAAYSQGDYAAAAQAFRDAYKLAPVNKVLFNLAQAELEANDKKNGCMHLRQYLQGADPNDQAAQQAAQQAQQSCP
jgi:TolA-binding protein